MKEMRKQLNSLVRLMLDQAKGEIDNLDIIEVTESRLLEGMPENVSYKEFFRLWVSSEVDKTLRKYAKHVGRESSSDGQLTMFGEKWEQGIDYVGGIAIPNPIQTEQHRIDKRRRQEEQLQKIEAAIADEEERDRILAPGYAHGAKTAREAIEFRIPSIFQPQQKQPEK